MNNADIANLMGHVLGDTATSLSKFITAHEPDLSDADLEQLVNQQKSMAELSTSFFDQADRLTFADSDRYAQQVKNVTGEIKSSLDHIDKVNKYISIGAGVLTLAGSLLQGNVDGIIDAVKGLAGAIAAPASAGSDD